MPSTRGFEWRTFDVLDFYMDGAMEFSGSVSVLVQGRASSLLAAGSGRFLAVPSLDLGASIHVACTTV